MGAIANSKSAIKAPPWLLFVFEAIFNVYCTFYSKNKLQGSVFFIQIGNYKNLWIL